MSPTLVIPYEGGVDFMRKVLRPLQHFFYMRCQVRRQMSRFRHIKWHVSSIFEDIAIGTADQAEFNEAQTILGDLSEQLIAFAKAHPLATFLLRRMGIDPFHAGRRLANLADELGSRNEDRDANFHAVTRLLKL